MGFYELKRQLEYQAALFGNYISVINQWFPSSKISNCGHQKHVLMLSEHVYVCKACGHKIDRDLNAAINLERESIRLQGITIEYRG